MASVGVKKQEHRGVRQRLVDEAVIREDILEDLAHFGGYKAQPKVELGAGKYVSLYRFIRAEQGGKACRLGYVDCIHNKCQGDDCDGSVCMLFEGASLS